MNHGQWKGRVEGDPSGLVVLDIDRVGDHYSGAACLFPDDPDVSNSLAVFDQINFPTHKSEVPVSPLDHTGRIIGFDQLASVFPDTTHPIKSTISLEKSGNQIEVSFETPTGTHGKGMLVLSESTKPSDLKPISSVDDWKSFKDFVSTNVATDQYRVMFRGQPCVDRLRTSFHRSCRSDLHRYINEDIPLLRRYLSPSVRHFFDMNDPIQVGAFYNLIQHHGYPTPLLDWTYSPYIAAYFAFVGAKNPDKNGFVRIFQFQSDTWRKKFLQFPIVANVRPHFSIIELLGVENPRMIPQQALSTLTNVDDIESYVATMESSGNERYLDVVQLPAADRSMALSELSLMGINEATLFPGLDTSCRFLRNRMFAE